MAVRYYRQLHPYYAGVDLHARSIALHVCDPAGRTLAAQSLRAAPGPRREAFARSQSVSLQVGVEW